MKLAVVLHEHWPEMLLSHPDLKLRDVLDRCRAEEVDGFLMAERSVRKGVEGGQRRGPEAPGTATPPKLM